MSAPEVDIPAPASLPAEGPSPSPSPSPSPVASAAPVPAPSLSPAPAPDLPGARFLGWCVAALAVAFALFVGGLAAGGRPERTASPIPARDPGNSLTDPLWDDGLAEVARYEAERPIYGAPRSYELIQVLVKEAFDPRTRTKPEKDRPGALDAMKLVRVEDVPTGKRYRYRQTLTLRIARGEPRRLLDAACGSQEWCGNTFCLVVPSGESFLRHVHSYFDGEGDRDDSLPGETWLEDQLPATLRGLALAPGFSLDVKLLPTIVSNRQPRTAPFLARIRVEGDEAVETAAGTFSCARVTVSREGETLSTLFFDREAPSALVRYETKDGRKGKLRLLERAAYWIPPPK